MISFQQVNKSFIGQDVLRDATFRIGLGERVGIVGPNGAGKSTVFSLLTGEINPDGGTVEVRKGARIGYVRQEINTSDEHTSLLDHTEGGRQDLADLHKQIIDLDHRINDQPGDDRDAMLARLGALQTEFESSGGYSVKTRAEAALCGLGFSAEDLTRPLDKFSGGWQMRAELARAIVTDPDILLLDEPSNYLDIPAVEWLQKYLKDFRSTLALVSHDRYLLNSLTTVTLEIANASASRYPGNYDFYVEERKLRHEQADAAYRNQDRRRQQIEKFVKRFRAKNTKSAQVQSRIKMLEKMEDAPVFKRVVSRGRIRLKTPVRCGQEVVRLDEISLRYDESHWVLKDIDLSVERGEKIALVGLNGMGKTTLLRLLAGRLPPSEGKRVVGHKVVPGYLSQEFAETMDPAETVLATVGSVSHDATDQDVRTLLGGFGFSGSAVDKRVSVLSGGEKVRLAFARLLIDPPNFLILDEPTTHLDVTARETLEDALRGYTGTICFVSHDIQFTRNVATMIIAMEPPGIRRYHGNYDYYRSKCQDQAAPQAANAATPAVSARKANRRERAERVQQLARHRRRLIARLTQAEESVERLSTEQHELTAALSNKDEPVDYATVNKRLEAIQREIDAATRLWEQTANELEHFNAQA